MYFYLPGSFGIENIFDITGWSMRGLERVLINSYNLNDNNCTL